MIRICRDSAVRDRAAPGSGGPGSLVELADSGGQVAGQHTAADARADIVGDAVVGGQRGALVGDTARIHRADQMGRQVARDPGPGQRETDGQPAAHPPAAGLPSRPAQAEDAEDQARRDRDQCAAEHPAQNATVACQLPCRPTGLAQARPPRAAAGMPPARWMRTTAHRLWCSGRPKRSQ